MRDLDPRWFRRHIGLVSQEPVLFACSIADNITYGKEDATKEEVSVLLSSTHLGVFKCPPNPLPLSLSD